MGVDSDGLEWAAATVWGGERRTDSRRIQRHVLPPQDEARRGEVLFVVVEGVGDDASTLFGETLARTLAADLESPPAAALSRALRTACVRLEAQALAPAELLALGASAVLIRDQEVLIAQVLPGQVYLLQQEQLRAWPDTPVAAPGREVLRRGQARRWDLEIEHSRATLRPGATLLVCTSELASRLHQSPHHVQRALALDTSRDAADWLCQQFARGAVRFDALVVRMTTADEREWQRQEPETDLGDELVEPEEWAEPEVPSRRRADKVREQRGLEPRPTPGIPGLTAALRQRWSSLFAGGAGRRGRPRRRRDAALWRTGEPGQPRGRPLPWGAIAVAAIAVLALVLVIRVLGQPRGTTVQPATPNPQVLAAAEQSVKALEVINDPVLGEAALANAITKVNALQPYPRYAERAAQLQATVVAQRARIAALVPPTPTPPALIRTAGRPAQFAAITGFGNRLYVLEQARAVFAVTPGEPPEELLQRGETKAGQTIGELAFLVATTDGVVAIDRTGHYWQIDATNTIRSGRLPGAAAWQQPVGFEGYARNLYAVDTGANQLLRWRPAAIGAFSRPPDLWFATPVPSEISSARDLAIDGDIFVLATTGQITRYRSGQPRPFDLRGLDRPLQNPQAIVTASHLRFLYVADSGNNRIVQLAKDGQFQRQFGGVSNPGEVVRDLWVDEAGGRIFVLTDQRLTEYQLPAEGGPSLILTPVPLP